jgi:hypothetical protein
MTASMPHLLIAGYVLDWLANPDVQRGVGVTVSFPGFTERVRTRTTGTLHGASPHQGPLRILPVRRSWVTATR